MIETTLKHGQVLGVKVTVAPKGEVINVIQLSLAKKQKFYITTPNPEIIVQAQKDKELREIINASDIALPDGIGLRLAGISTHIPGRELFEHLLKVASEKNLRVYLFGSTKDVNSGAVAKAQKMYTGLKIRGTSGPGIDSKGFVGESNRSVMISILSDINKFNPDLLFVALGAPKQEKWLYHNIDELKIGGAMVVGGALDYFVGRMPKPPKLFGSIGLEWLWRLVHEPKRIKRIFNAIVVFPLLVLKKSIMHY